MKFEEVLQEVGEFGVYQKRLILLICITGGCVIAQNLSPVFTIAIPKHRCRIPGLPNDTFAVQSDSHAQLINQTIPLKADGEYAQCTVYDVTSSGDTTLVNRTERKCESWVYDRSIFTETLTSQLDLVCDNKMYRSHTSMMIFVGKFVGALLTSVFGDYFGRRRVYTFMMLAMLANSVALVFVSSLPVLMVLRFFAGGTTTGSYLCAFVIGMELMGKSQRRYISLGFTLCQICTAFLACLAAYLLRHWSHFQAFLACPCALVLICYFLIPESPRWLLSKGRLKDAQKVMDHVAKVNGAPPPSRLDADPPPFPISLQSAGPAVSPLQLFRVPRLCVRYTLLYLCWVLIIMNTYGLILNVSTMSGDIYLNFAILTCMDGLSLVLSALLVERLGRRLLLSSVTALGGLACLATIVPTVLGSDPWVLRGLSMTGRFGTSAAMVVIYVLSPELFPTVLRSFGLGSCSMLSRIGGLASPYVADLNTYVEGAWGTALPQIVFGVAGLSTSAMVLTFPETRGRRIPETVSDAVEFGRKKTAFQGDMEIPVTADDNKDK